MDEEDIVQFPPTVILCTRPKAVTYLTHFLEVLDIRATALHFWPTQREMLNPLNLFRASVISVLVSTDVGARGLDIERVTLIVNWEVPTKPEKHMHCVERTGMAVGFIIERDEDRVEARNGILLGSPRDWKVD